VRWLVLGGTSNGALGTIADAKRNRFELGIWVRGEGFARVVSVDGSNDVARSGIESLTASTWKIKMRWTKLGG